MFRHVLPISALLLGSGFLLFAGGINSLILPVRGSAEGFSAVSLGLLGTGWAVGYVSGCILMPRLVGRVGHVRSFGVTAALAAISILLSLLLITPWAWIPLRGLAGFCFAGAAMIVESWLSDNAPAEQRGRIFGIYTMVNLFASTGGQMLLTLGDTAGFTFFVAAAIFYCLALVPTAISSSQSPAPLLSVSLDLKALWRNSPVAVFAVFMVGVSNAAFGTLAAVYADRVGLALTSIALFTAMPILAGALAQVPVGLLSDRMDRRKVLLGVAALALVADAAFLLLAPDGRVLNLALAAVFGAAVFSMYPVIVAHANDHAPPGSAIQVSGGLLLVFGVGSILGPLAAGAAMAAGGPSSLFAVTVAAHLAIVLFTLLRMRLRGGVAQADKVDFRATQGRTATPQTAVLAERDQHVVDEALGLPPDPRPAAKPGMSGLPGRGSGPRRS
ncbi:MFS transporter [Rhodobacteraceae bacterium CCMM004]|nr:MFS transporter [Rhodobacteraceae bacterium CCMM004]